MRFQGQPPSVNACFIADDKVPSLPHQSGGISIQWSVIQSNELTLTSTLGYELIAATAEVLSTCLATTPSGRKSKPSRAVVTVMTHDDVAVNASIATAIREHFPTSSLGQINPETATIADHLFFNGLSQPFYDRFLLPSSASNNEVRRRFRRLSQRLHPDRFVERTDSEPHLVARMESVYTIVGDTYRALSDPLLRAVHRYWLQQNQLDKAIGLHLSSKMRKVISALSGDQEQGKLIHIMMLQDHGLWTDAGEAMEALVAQHPSNRALRKWQESIADVLMILSKE